VYTGFIYEGPGIVRNINKYLVNNSKWLKSIMIQKKISFM
jgi:dihydroorotate dehydrogenase